MESEEGSLELFTYSWRSVALHRENLVTELTQFKQRKAYKERVFIKYFKINQKRHLILAASSLSSYFLCLIVSTHFITIAHIVFKVFEKEKIKSCLETVFDYNVMKYENGRAGAVNGMRPDGNIDISSLQSEEMWVGTTDALASLMIFEV